MITRYESDITLADREVLQALLDRPTRTIRAHCEPVACDTLTRRALYDLDQVTQTMADLPRRFRRQSTTSAARG